jgi:uncharacterized protein (DUF1499 family)
MPDQHLFRFRSVVARKPSAVLWLVLLMSGVTGCAHSVGLSDGRLAPCPSGPHCVSSQATTERHSIEPLAYRSTPAETKRRLKAAVAALPRTRLVTETDNYMHYEVTTLILRYVDDLEFYFDDSARQVHVRSSSRVGYYDFGVNRGRVEAIRSALGDTSAR